MAHARLRRNQPITLLDTTGLVHETWLRFQKSGPTGTEDRSRFLAYAGRVMRSIIVDFIRQRNALRRGGGEVVTLDTEVSLRALVQSGRESTRRWKTWRNWTSGW